MEQVVIAASGSKHQTPEDVGIQVFGLKAGTVYSSWKRCYTSPQGIAILDQNDLQSDQSMIISTEKDKPYIQFWKWDKDVPDVRSAIAERAQCVVVAKQGMLLFAGGAAGNCMVWDLLTGALLKTWQAHFRGITSLALTDDESFLVSGGDDALIHTWNLGDVLGGSGSSARVQPHCSWSGHTLAITSLSVGPGGVNGRVVSTSADHSCKVWSIPSNKCLCTLTFPCDVTTAVMDGMEHTLYVGGSDGRIYASDLNTRTKKQFSDDMIFNGHDGRVNALVLSGDNSVLVSGGDDAAVRFWDIQSRQQIRAIKTAFHSVASLTVAQKDHIVSSSNANSGAKSKKSTALALNSLPPLCKFATTVREAEGMQTLLVRATSELEPTVEQQRSVEVTHFSTLNDYTAASSMAANVASIDEGGETDGNALKRKIEHLEEQNRQYQAVNRSLLKMVSTQ